MTDAHIRRLADQLNALAEPIRMAFLDVLMTGSRTSGDFCKMFGMNPSLASYHLGVLRAAGIVQHTRRGRFIENALTPEIWADGELTLAGGWRVRVRR